MRAITLALVTLFLLGQTITTQAQNRRDNNRRHGEHQQPQRPTKEFKSVATVKGVAIAQGVLHLVDPDGEQFLVKVPEKGHGVKLTGSAVAEWVKPGMFIRFTNRFDRRGRPLDPIESITVFTPRQANELGVFSEQAAAPAAPAGGIPDDLFGEAPKPQAKPSNDKVNPETIPYVVAGRLTSNRRGKISVSAGRAAFRAEFAENLTVNVDVADYRFARPGDEVEVQGWYYPPQKTHIFAERLSITAKDVLGQVTPAAKPPAAGGEKEAAASE